MVAPFVVLSYCGGIRKSPAPVQESELDPLSRPSRVGSLLRDHHL